MCWRTCSNSTCARHLLAAQPTRLQAGSNTIVGRSPGNLGSTVEPFMPGHTSACTPNPAQNHARMLRNQQHFWKALQGGSLKVAAQTGLIDMCNEYSLEVGAAGGFIELVCPVRQLQDSPGALRGSAFNAVICSRCIGRQQQEQRVSWHPHAVDCAPFHKLRHKQQLHTGQVLPQSACQDNR